MYGYRFTTEKEKIATAIEEYYKLIYEDSYKFLKSKKGREWFEDAISTYIYPKTASYDETLGEGIAPSLIEDEDIFNYNIAVREAKKIKIEDMKEFLQERSQIPPHIWIEGDMSKSELKRVVEESSFTQRFESKV